MGKDRSDTLENVIDHLEFFGYEINKSEENDNLFLASTETAGHPNIIGAVNNTRIFMRASWTGFDARAAASKEFNEILNQVNANTAVALVYYDLDDDSMRINVCVAQFGYDKKDFGELYEEFLSDNKGVLQALQQFSLNAD